MLVLFYTLLLSLYRPGWVMDQEAIQSRFPLHYLVWRNAKEPLAQHLQTIPHSSVCVIWSAISNYSLQESFINFILISHSLSNRIHEVALLWWWLSHWATRRVQVCWWSMARDLMPQTGLASLVSYFVMFILACHLLSYRFDIQHFKKQLPIKITNCVAFWMPITVNSCFALWSIKTTKSLQWLPTFTLRWIFISSCGVSIYFSNKM